MLKERHLTMIAQAVRASRRWTATNPSGPWTMHPHSRDEIEDLADALEDVPGFDRAAFVSVCRQRKDA